MQINVQQLEAEAGRMALEIRFKDQLIAALTDENKDLVRKIAELEEVVTKPEKHDHKH